MSETKKIPVTEETIQHAQKSVINDPIMHALGSVTASVWTMTLPGVALETSAPYRAVLLRGEVFERWRTYKMTKEIAPFEFEVQIPEPREQPEHQQSKQ